MHAIARPLLSALALAGALALPAPAGEAAPTANKPAPSPKAAPSVPARPTPLLPAARPGAADMPTARPAPEGWLTNYDEALAKAAKENKKVLALVTGSDWCGFCRRLREQIIDKEEFQNFAKDKLVGLYVDMPMRSDMTPEQKAYNRKLAAKLAGDAGVPVTLLLEPDGTLIDRVDGFSPQYVEHLRKALAPVPPLLAAARAGDVAKLRELIEKGADLKETDAFGKTAVETALHRHHPEALALLLEKGAAMDAPGHQPLLEQALAMGAPVAVIRLLLQRGADPNATREDGPTPMHFSVAFYATPEVLQTLAAAGGKYDILDGQKMSLLHVAAMCERLEIAKLLLEKGVDKTLRDSHGHVAADYAEAPALRALLQPPAPAKDAKEAAKGDKGAANEKGANGGDGAEKAVGKPGAK